METMASKVSVLLIIVASGSATALAASPSHLGPGAPDGSVHSTSVMPPALQPVFYRSLAKNAGAAYNMNSEDCAILTKQAIKACFDSKGAHFTSDGSLSLHLIAYGRSQTMTPVTTVQPTIKGNQVSYGYGNLKEWWSVLPFGFEQGFTVMQRPAGNGELTLSLAASEKPFQERRSLSWGQIRYGRLVVTDANGKVIPATLKNEGSRVLIAVNDDHATYPLTVDPLVWLEQEVAGNPQDELGYSVAVNGTTAFIGVPNRAIKGNAQQGGVEVFNKTNGVWTLSQVITDDNSLEFGTFISFDGTSVLIGAPYTNINGIISAGAAFIFKEVNGAWVETAELVANDLTQSGTLGFGGVISGNLAFVAAVYPYFDEQESVYVFTQSNGAWSQTQKIVSPNQAGDFFGYIGSIAVAGTTAIIGASAANVNGIPQGNATVYTESNGTWSQVQQLTRSNGQSGDNFGIGVAMNDDTALISADKANGGTGEVDLFTQSGGTWTQTGTVTASDGVANDYFGRTVNLDGQTALIGADGYNSLNGKAYIFNNVNGSWTQTQELIPSDQPVGGFFGYSSALSGSTALVGAWFANSLQGAAYFYGGSDLGLSMSAPLTVGQGEQYTSQTIATNSSSAASPAVSASIAVPAAASFISATATQGSCNEASGVVTCDFGPINGNAGAASANVTLKATGSTGTTIENTASVDKATPALTASAPTTISTASGCPDGYTERDGTLAAGGIFRSPAYSAPAGQENAILTAPGGFRLYVLYASGGSQHLYRIPGNEVHRYAPAGTYRWGVQAGGSGGAYMLCIMHP